MKNDRSIGDSARLPTLTSVLLGSLRSSAPQLSPLERRLVEIARELWSNATILVRCKEAERPPEPLSPEVAVEAARLALAAAVEIEGSLREIRDAIARKHDASS